MRLNNYINESEESEAKKRWKEYLSSNSMLKNGVDIMKKITKAGGNAWIAGGAVRDIILGDSPHDIDIATDMDMNKLGKLFKVYDIGRSNEFGIVSVNQGGFTYEIAMLRGESYVKPKTVRKILT